MKKKADKKTIPAMCATNDFWASSIVVITAMDFQAALKCSLYEQTPLAKRKLRGRMVGLLTEVSA